ncbi:uncharacterized protein LOC141613420 [Silene latifolia]|uniref:uncharacterized protein LOC141613420 n=1 Tax=Silene latifolia TaxID=37657 RepID=UPI003D776D47
MIRLFLYWKRLTSVTYFSPCFIDGSGKRKIITAVSVILSALFVSTLLFCLWKWIIHRNVKLLKLDKPLKHEKEEKVKPLKGDKIQKHEKEVEIKLLKGDKPLKEEEEEDVKLLKKYKPRKHGREADICEDERQEKRQRKVLSGFLAPLPLSDTLIRFLGTGETALTHPEVIKSVEVHKKQSTPERSRKETLSIHLPGSRRNRLLGKLLSVLGSRFGAYYADIMFADICWTLSKQDMLISPQISC